MSTQFAVVNGGAFVNRAGIMHPTKRKLLDAVIELLEEKTPQEILSEEVLRKSGVVKGSMYHHFADFPELLETAQLELFANWVNTTLLELQAIMATGEDYEATKSKFIESALASQRGNTPALRHRRLALIVAAASSPRLAEKLGAIQERLTQNWIRIIELAQSRGWANPSDDPRAMAILMQSTMVGRAFDDISPVHVDREGYKAMVCRFIEFNLFGFKK